ncbi:MAG: arginase [Cereibacter sphaeroides]|uniref:Arginase n=1 Tax=Cereibacter sphaeroides TaxID=1063 RepID=A0A2W5SK81_CERSP|nr:MAG: arginase [Cereibacter sphaeroides]
MKLSDMLGAGAAETFLELPKGDLAKLGAKIALIGADGCTPYASVGFYCAGGPAAIRNGATDYGAILSHMNFDLGGPVFPNDVVAVDCGDLPVDPGDAAGNRALLKGAVSQVLDQGAVPVLIGGDDSLPIPMLQAFEGRGRKLTILQIDAHIDWRNEVQGENWGLSSTMRRASEMGHVERIIQVGQRGMGSARASEVEDAVKWGVEFVSGREVARDGIGRALSLVPEGADVVICLDCDALDPAVMPAVIGRTAGGLSYNQVLDLVAGVQGKARIAAFDMVEFVPSQDIGGQGALTAAQLLTAVLGLIARQV